ncbi:hypothetical protein ACFLWG_03930, partial [Chloroflexota bacterium]
AGVQDISCSGCGSNDMERLISSSYLVKAGSPSSGAKHRPAPPARGATDIKGVTTCRNLSGNS